jgi:hypothetical protein
MSACASGADALGTALEVIKRGDAVAMIAGGAEASVTRMSVAAFAASRALSRNEAPETASRPFDLNRDGFVLGEGAGILVLEEREHAIARGATILAEFASYGQSADAYHVTQPSEGGEGAARAMNMALRKAGITASDVDYINAHGTSTPLNDKFETMSIKAVFGEAAYTIPVSSARRGRRRGGCGDRALAPRPAHPRHVPPGHARPRLRPRLRPRGRARAPAGVRDVKQPRLRRPQLLAGVPPGGVGVGLWSVLLRRIVREAPKIRLVVRPGILHGPGTFALSGAIEQGSQRSALLRALHDVEVTDGGYQYETVAYLTRHGDTVRIVMQNEVVASLPREDATSYGSMIPTQPEAVACRIRIDGGGLTGWGEPLPRGDLRVRVDLPESGD